MDPNQLLVIGVADAELSSGEFDLIRSLQPGGFVLAGAALLDIGQARRLTDALRAACEQEPLIILKSDDTGVWPMQLLDGKPPTPASLRDQADPRVIMTAGWIAGRLLRVIGVNLHLSPDLQVGDWGNHDQQVINHAGTFNRYQRKQGVLGAGLPFPGGPSCAGLEISDLLRSPLLPFTALMPELDALLVDDTVFGNIDPKHPASKSPSIITRLLRDQLGYKRLVLADSHDGASIAGGADMLMLPDVHSAPEALRSLEGLSGYQLSDAIDRVEFARKRLHKPSRIDAKVLDRLQGDARDLSDRM